MEDIIIEAKTITEWLESRRKLKKDWVQSYKAIELKTSEIVDYIKTLNITNINNMINKASTNDFALTYIDYEKMLEHLKNSKEGEQLSMFGNYSAKSIKDLQALLKLYSRDNLHLVNLSKNINQILKFERPSTNKNIESQESDILYCQGKILQLQSSINTTTEEKQRFLKKLDFEDDLNFEQKLDQFVFSLPEKIKEFQEQQSNPLIKDFIDYFYENVSVLNPKLEFSQIRLSILEHLILYGDTEKTVYDRTLQSTDKSQSTSWIKISELGNSSCRYSYEKLFKQKGFHSLMIGDTGTDMNVADTAIDWGFEIVENSQNNTADNQNTFEINWDIPTNTDSNQNATDTQEIKWDIEETAKNTENNQKTIEESYCFEIVDEFIIENEQSNVKDDSPIAESVLCDRQLREQLLGQINEIQNFFFERKFEQDQNKNLVLKNYDMDFCNIKKLDQAKLKSAIDLFTSLKAKLNEYQMRQLFAQLESNKAKTRIVDNYSSYNNLISKNERAIKNYNTQIEDDKANINEQRNKLKLLNSELNNCCKKTEGLVGEIIGRRVVVTKSKN